MRTVISAEVGAEAVVVEMKVEELRVDLKPVDKAVKGEHFSIKVAQKVRPSDRLYVWRPAPPRPAAPDFSNLHRQ